VVSGRRTSANGSGSDGHVSFFFFFCSRMDVVYSSKADRFLMNDPLGTALNLPNREPWHARQETRLSEN